MKTIEGDLLEITDGIIMHQVNCIGATGGLAGAIRRKWPMAFARYDEMCEEYNSDRTIKNTLLGCYSCSIIRRPYSVAVCHIFGQYLPGPNTDLVAVDRAVGAFSKELNRFGLDVYAPYKMGCGLGGGNWDEYLKVLVKHIPEITIVKRKGD